MLNNEMEQRPAARRGVLEMVSHDLKNPLTTIIMAADFMLEELVPNDVAHTTQREQLRLIGRAAGRMRQLASDLLDASALESGRLRVNRYPVPVDAILADVVEAFQRFAAAKRVALFVQTEEGMPGVHADRDRVGQVLSNLVANALRFTPRGGRVSLCAGRAGDAIEFSVIDTGCGISPDDLPHIFDRYWQAPGSARLGSGLGLSIARGIVEAHDGRLDARSALGEGSTFTFTLPIAAPGAGVFQAWSA